MLQKKYLNVAEAAEYLSVSEPFLNRKRCDGTGPEYCRFGARSIRYSREALDHWIAQHRRASTSEAVDADAA